MEALLMAKSSLMAWVSKWAIRTWSQVPPLAATGVRGPGGDAVGGAVSPVHAEFGDLELLVDEVATVLGAPDGDKDAAWSRVPAAFRRLWCQAKDAARVERATWIMAERLECGLEWGACSLGPGVACEFVVVSFLL